MMDNKYAPQEGFQNELDQFNSKKYKNEKLFRDSSENKENKNMKSNISKITNNNSSLVSNK